MDTDWRGIRDRTTYSPERFTLLNLFDAGISGRDFEHGKPHPMISLDDVAVNALSEARLDRATIR